MNPLIEQFNQLLSETQSRFTSVHAQEAQESLKQEVLGRKGRLAALMAKIPGLEAADRGEAGKHANEVKQALEQLFVGNATSHTITSEQLRDSRTWTHDPRHIEGHKHPISLFYEKVNTFFVSLGYDILDSPELEDEKHNFDLLNIPKDHPARDESDTFFVKSGKRQDSILRTQTSPMQIRAMKKRKPPVRIIVPGRVFRHEATDASHSASFYQCEVFLIGRHITLRHLKGTLDACIKSIFGQGTETRFRPHYYPFVEPGMDMDMKFKGEWLEVLGSGMIHFVVLTNMGIDASQWSGFAFGLGIDRLAMLYWGIEDIRHLYSGSMTFGSQFY